eukprot:CAMPEP_0175046530 /NCGR_PEP_ID=MMETSP0052_2-20121109/5082_1 /TAXON_ID=51329 ORGANISM="Polytomella parva, Strain SAG 63-3" /NCGR_SAMPLE_ID=MMETSP0052_2 /ASSEMBLY_ACC=CAM_ASM_000194 /LENGTH=569 /DNA_ID=CAMNT_0016310287 /DNA_START=163 /DNA_END=1869 /DNA_ORIENTATION=+
MDISITPLSGGANDESPMCYLLEVAHYKILLDCGTSHVGVFGLRPGEPDLFKAAFYVKRRKDDQELLRKVRKLAPYLDAILVSHPDIHHMGLLPAVLSRDPDLPPIYVDAYGHRVLTPPPRKPISSDNPSLAYTTPDVSRLLEEILEGAEDPGHFNLPLIQCPVISTRSTRWLGEIMLRDLAASASELSQSPLIAAADVSYAVQDHPWVELSYSQTHALPWKRPSRRTVSSSSSFSSPGSDLDREEWDEELSLVDSESLSYDERRRRGVERRKLWQRRFESGELLTVTPVAAGRVVGGAAWRINFRGESVVYAVDFNHRRDRLLPEPKLSQRFSRPSVLITDARDALIDRQRQLGGGGGEKGGGEKGEKAGIERSAEERELFECVKATLEKGGTVMLLADVAGRALEVAFALRDFLRSNPTLGASPAAREAKGSGVPSARNVPIYLLASGATESVLPAVAAADTKGTATTVIGSNGFRPQIESKVSPSAGSNGRDQRQRRRRRRRRAKWCCEEDAPLPPSPSPAPAFKVSPAVPSALIAASLESAAQVLSAAAQNLDCFAPALGDRYAR